MLLRRPYVKCNLTKGGLISVGSIGYRCTLEMYMIFYSDYNSR